MNNNNKNMSVTSIARKSALALALFSSVASAQGEIDFSQYELALSAGATSYDIENSSRENVAEYGIGLSTNHKSDFFLEFMATQTDSVEYQKGGHGYDLDSTSVNTSLNYNFLSGEKYNVYSGMGLSVSKSKTIGLKDGEYFSDSKYNVSPIVNVGAMYDINDSVALGLRYRHNFDVDGDSHYNIKEMDSDSVLLTLNFKFPSKTEKLVKTEMVYKEKLVEVTKTEVYSTQSSVYFDIGSAEVDLTKELSGIEDVVSKRFTPNYLIYVNGHASDIGSENHNVQLTKDRAEFVKQQIVDKLSSIDPNVESKVIVNQHGYKYHSEDSKKSQRVDVSVALF
ncbi:outer membrane beta-barrel protein [Vibrio owensii]|uniref:outer membrane beta-barrel protein n=1 Tax=Vibrio harveyi group TaxID=717610 RepID=UPI003CC66055